MVVALRERMERLHTELQHRIVADKLSGQVLQERTGTLRRSITERTDADADLIRSQVFTNVVYAAIHEFGGVILPTSAKALVFEIDGRKIFAQKVTIPKRPYMIPTFAAMRAEIVAGLQAAVDEAIGSEK